MSARQVVGGVEDGGEQPREAPLERPWSRSIFSLARQPVARHAVSSRRFVDAGRWSRSRLTSSTRSSKRIGFFAGTHALGLR